MSDVKVINVSGRRFEVGKDILSRFPDSTLGRLAASDKTEVTYQRQTSVFKYVLVYYETGHLHIPLSVCPGAIQEELAFWGFSIDNLDPCCRRKLRKFHREQEDFSSFEKSFTQNSIKDGGCCHLPTSCMTRGRQYLWMILDKPMSSLFGKIYFIMSSLIILLSLLTLFLGTMDDFHEAMSVGDWRMYMGSRYEEYEDGIEERAGRLPQNTNPNSGNNSMPEGLFVENRYLENIHAFCITFFTVELILKLVCCPSILLFFKSYLNVIDTLSVIVSLAEILAEEWSATERYTENYMDALEALQVLRALRLLRLAKNIPGARVLAFAVSSSYKELCFMGLLLSIGAIVFGTLVYSVDNDKMEDMPIACWWALVTMTTVGYGDIVPSNHLGRFVGVLCACMGIAILSLTMPLFVDNFITMYAYGHEICKDQEKNSKKNSKTFPRDGTDEKEKVVA